MQKLQVVVAHRPPFVFVTNSSGSLYFSGLLIDLLNRILITSNASYQYDIYVSPQNAGGTLSNGVWNGVIGELTSQRADIALFPLTRTASRLAVIDCTFSYYDAGLALLVLQEQTAPGPLSVLAPFSLTLWITLLCTVIGVALLFWALDAYGKWIRNKQFDALRASGVLSERVVARAKREEGNPVLISFMAAAGAPERPGRNSWGVQVMYVVYCFFCLIVLSSYTANLTSFLAVRRSYVGLSGLQDLVKINGLVGVNPNGSTAAYFASSKDSLATQLQPNVRYCDSTTCVRWVREGVVQAFVTDQPVLLYLSQQQPCDTAVVGDPFGPGNLVIGLQKNSSLQPLFNSAIQTFSEDGTLSTLRRAWFDGLSQCESSAQLDNTRLNVAQMLGAFLFLVMGILVAFSIGTVENLKWCIARAYAKSYSESGTLQSITSLARQAEEAQQARRPVLMQQASRLRAATWHRLSVSLLGLPNTQLAQSRSLEDGALDAPTQQPPPTSEAVKGASAEWPVNPPWPPPPPPPQQQQPSPSMLFSSAVAAAGGATAVAVGAAPAALNRVNDPESLQVVCSGNRPGSAVAAGVTAGAAAQERRNSLPFFSLAADFNAAAATPGPGPGPAAEAPWRRDVLRITHDGAGGGGSGKAIGGGDIGSGKIRLSLSVNGTASSPPAAALGEGGRLTDDGGSPLQLPSLLPMMPLLSSSDGVQGKDHRHRGNNLALPGQPSVGAGGSSSGAQPPPSPPPPPAAAIGAATSGRLSPRWSNRVTPSCESSSNGALLFRKDDSQRIVLPPPPPPQEPQPVQGPSASPPPRPQERLQLQQLTRSPSSSAARTMPFQDELTTFSDVSSSDDEDRSAIHASLSFAVQATAPARNGLLLELRGSSEEGRKRTL